MRASHTHVQIRTLLYLPARLHKNILVYQTWFEIPNQIFCGHSVGGITESNTNKNNRLGPDIRWPDIIRPDIDFCRISGYPVSGFLRTGYPAGYPVSGKSTGYPVSGHFAGLSGRIFDYFEQKFKTYPIRQLSSVLSYFTWQKWHLNIKIFRKYCCW